MRPLVVVSLLLAVGLAGCTDDFVVEAPEWQSGYAFAYTTDATAQGSFIMKHNGETVEEEVDGEVEGFSHLLRVLSTRFADGDEPMYVGAFYQEGAFDALVGVRQSDLQEVAVRLADGCPPACTTIAFEDAEAHPALRFPLEPGATWSTTIEDEGFDGKVVMTAEVKGLRAVGLEDRRVEAVHVRHTLDMVGLKEQIKEAEDELRAAGMDDVSMSLAIDAHFDMDYAPALETVVRSVTDMDVRFRLAFKEGSDRYEMSGDLHMEAVSLLAGATYEPAADMSTEQIISFLTDPSLPDVPGDIGEAPEDDFRLRVTADPDEANAAQDQSVTFSAERRDGESLDAGVAWRLLDGSGTAVATATGPTFTHAFTEPGAYTAVAEARDGDGDLLARAARAIPVHFEASLQAACGPVNLVDLLPCDAVVVPVRSGATALHMAAADDGTGLDTGTLVLTGPDGATFEGPGAVTLGATDLRGRHGDWSAQWHPDVALLGTATYDVQALHGEAGGAVPAPSAGQLVWGAMRAHLPAPAADALHVPLL